MLCYGCTTLALAQKTSPIDSLKNGFVTAATPESKSTIAYQIADRYRNEQADSARQYADFALDFAKKAQKPALEANAYYLNSLVLRDAVAFEQSLQSSQTALNLYESMGDKKGIGKAYGAMGLTYKKMGDAQKVTALTFNKFEQNLRKIEGIFLRYIKIQKSENHFHFSISQAYQAKKDFNQAIFYAEKSVALAQELNDAHRSFNAYSMLSKAQEGAGLYPKALENFKMAKMLEDSTKWYL